MNTNIRLLTISASLLIELARITKPVRRRPTLG
jgi:hypothetical protein